MARPSSAAFGEKYRRVQRAIEATRGSDRRHFDFTREVEPGVRLVLSEAGGTPVAFSLWSLSADIAEICGDASMPATAALLAIDGGQVGELRSGGIAVDLAQFSRSQSRPEMYYTLLDRASPGLIHDVLHRLVPSLGPHVTAA